MTQLLSLGAAIIHRIRLKVPLKPAAGFKGAALLLSDLRGNVPMQLKL